MWLIFLIKLFLFQNISIAWYFSETPDIILKKTTGLSLGNESSDCHYNQPIKSSLSHFFKFFKIHSYNLRELITNITRSIISSLDILPPSKISWLWNFYDLTIGFWKAWQRVILFTLFGGRPYPDISWPEIKSLSFICILYFQLQSLRLALPNERRRRQNSSLLGLNTDRL